MALTKVPVPLDVQATAVWLVALAPAVILREAVVAHMVKAVPATAVITLLMLRVFVAVAFPQGVFPYAVKVSVTLPAVISAALGV